MTIPEDLFEDAFWDESTPPPGDVYTGAQEDLLAGDLWDSTHTPSDLLDELVYSHLHPVPPALHWGSRDLEKGRFDATTF